MTSSERLRVWLTVAQNPRFQITDAGRAALARDKCEQFRPRALPLPACGNRFCVPCSARAVDNDATGAK